MSERFRLPYALRQPEMYAPPWFVVNRCAAWFSGCLTAMFQAA
nr:hypothetical protein [uncultured Kingella sp.]